jgi:hypothetical protein
VVTELDTAGRNQVSPWSTRSETNMTIQPLTSEFKATQHNINLGVRRTIAVAAHLEVRAALLVAVPLTSRGLDDILIGSYRRNTGIWPGKDVDVFGKLTEESIESISPELAYSLFYGVLTEAFPGRVSPQARSVKVDYKPDVLPDAAFVREAAAFLKESAAVPLAEGFEFSVDVVPAVHFGEVWGIPQRDRDVWTRAAASDRWTRTDPEELTELTQKQNAGFLIGGQGAYVPTVKAVRQIRRSHLGDLKPGGFYFELLTYEGFSTGQITGNSWAEVTASTLSHLAVRLRTAGSEAVCDPALGQPYRPAPAPAALAHAADVFAGLAAKAQSALESDLCPAAAKWREIFGTNTQANGPVFPLPSGCRSDGTMMPPIINPNPLRGTNEAHGFG